MDDSEDILLKGRLIEETATYGESQWGRLGGIAFTILPLVPLSQKLITYFPTRIQELILHIMLYWRAGFYKSTMIKTFAEQILNSTNWRVHKIGQITVPAIRGSVSIQKRQGQVYATFVPPAPMKGEIVYNTELATLLKDKSIQASLQTWLGDQSITNSNAYIGHLDTGRRVMYTRRYPGLFFKGNSYTANIRSSFITAINTASVDIKTFDSSTYDRVGILTFPDSELDEEIAYDVNLLPRNPPPEELIKAWDFVSSITLEGPLPDIPLEWKRQMSGLPRMLSRQTGMIYAYSLALLPYECGHLCTPEEPYTMQLSEKAFEMSQEVVEFFKTGSSRIDNDVDSLILPGKRERRNREYDEYVDTQLAEGTLTCQGFADEFSLGVEAARRQFEKRGLVRRGRNLWI